MRVLHTIFPFIFCIVFYSNCSNSKVVTGNQDKVEVHNVLIFPPYSSIDVIETKNEMVQSDSLSLNSAKQIIYNLGKYIPVDVERTFLGGDDSLNKRVADTSIRFLKMLRRSTYPKKLKVPDLLLNILDSLNKDFALIIFHGGFTRSSENLKTEYIKRKEIAFLSLGLYDTEPYQSYSTMIGLMIDKKTRKVFKYEERRWRDSDPNAATVIRSQIRDIILNSFK